MLVKKINIKFLQSITLEHFCRVSIYAEKPKAWPHGIVPGWSNVLLGLSFLIYKKESENGPESVKYNY